MCSKIFCFDQSESSPTKDHSALWFVIEQMYTQLEIKFRALTNYSSHSSQILVQLKYRILIQTCVLQDLNLTQDARYDPKLGFVIKYHRFNTHICYICRYTEDRLERIVYRTCYKDGKLFLEFNHYLHRIKTSFQKLINYNFCYFGTERIETTVNRIYSKTPETGSLSLCGCCVAFATPYDYPRSLGLTKTTKRHFRFCW